MSRLDNIFVKQSSKRKAEQKALEILKNKKNKKIPVSTTAPKDMRGKVEYAKNLSLQVFGKKLDQIELVTDVDRIQEYLENTLKNGILAVDTETNGLDRITALATGRGEIIQPIPSPPKCWVILIKPRIGVSTKEIYEALDANQVEHLDIEGMLKCIDNKDYQGICDRLGNSLEEVTLERYPVVAEIKNKLVQFGADAVLMSGSGPTVFALVRKEYKLRRIINSINGCFREHEVHAVRLIG